MVHMGPSTLSYASDSGVARICQRGGACIGAGSGGGGRGPPPPNPKSAPSPPPPPLPKKKGGGEWARKNMS